MNWLDFDSERRGILACHGVASRSILDRIVNDGEHASPVAGRPHAV